MRITLPVLKVKTGKALPLQAARFQHVSKIGENSKVSLRRHYPDQVKGIISARGIKAPLLLKFLAQSIPICTTPVETSLA